MTDQLSRCRRFGRHKWTRWGLFKEERGTLPYVPFTADPVPVSVTLKAYRYRYCECGAMEREDWGTSERVIIVRGVDS